MDNNIDFTVMGLDIIASNYLNWCMKNRNNLEYIKECNVMELKSASAGLFFDEMGGIGRIDRQLVDRRQVFHSVDIRKTLDTRIQ